MSGERHLAAHAEAVVGALLTELDPCGETYSGTDTRNMEKDLREMLDGVTSDWVLHRRNGGGPGWNPFDAGYAEARERLVRRGTA